MAAAALVVLQHHEAASEHGDSRGLPGNKESVMGSALGRLEEHLHKLLEAQKVFKVQTESHWDKLQEQGRHLDQEVAALRLALSRPVSKASLVSREERPESLRRPAMAKPLQHQSHNQQDPQEEAPAAGAAVLGPQQQQQAGQESPGKAEDNNRLALPGHQSGLSPTTPQSYCMAGGDCSGDDTIYTSDSGKHTLTAIKSTPMTPAMAMTPTIEGGATMGQRFTRERRLVAPETRVRWLRAMGDGFNFKKAESNKWRWCTLQAWREAVKSPFFDLLVGILIVANTVALSLKVEYEGWVRYKEVINCKPDRVCSAEVENVELSFEVLEQVFTAVFAIELLMRMAAEGRSYIRSPANIGDALIVLISCIDSWILVPSDKSFTNVSVIRMVKLLRLLKVLRVVRVMRAFKSLRIMVNAVASSVGALAWSMTLLFVLELLGAIFLAQMLASYVEDVDAAPELREWLWNRFGTWTRSMLTIFEITMAPGGFVQYRRLHDEVHPLFFYFIVVYVCFVTFAVVRVITAMFLKATLSAADEDDASIAVEKTETNKAYVKRLQDFIEEADTDRPGYIPKGELIAMLDVPRMQDWLEDVELPKREAERLFHALDPGDGCISIDEFLNALTRMRGAARAADTVVGLYESRKILDHLTSIEDRLSGRAPASAERKAAAASQEW